MKFKQCEKYFCYLTAEAMEVRLALLLSILKCVITHTESEGNVDVLDIFDSFPPLTCLYVVHYSYKKRLNFVLVIC